MVDVLIDQGVGKVVFQTLQNIGAGSFLLFI